MKYLEISVGKSLNPLTGESWIKTDAKVSVGEDENPELVFQKVKSDIESWLGNSYSNNDEMKGTIIKPVEEEIPKSTKEQYLLDLISMSTTKVGLERFRNQITELNNEEVNRAFDKRMNEVD